MESWGVKYDDYWNTKYSKEISTQLWFIYFANRKLNETIACEVINTLKFDTGTDAFYYAEIKKMEH